MDDLVDVLIATILLVPAVVLMVRLPENLAATFSTRRDDPWPVGVQEQDVPSFRWDRPERTESQATAKVRGSVSRRGVSGQSRR